MQLLNTTKNMPATREKNLYVKFEKWLNTLEYCRFKKIKGSLTSRNEPDYLVVIRNRAILIEFKRLGEKIRESQIQRIGWWSKACRATYCDTLEDAKIVVLEEERIAKLHKALEDNLAE